MKLTTRSWTWGPNSSFNGYEPYKEGRDGRRLVQYFDKTRMEINNPSMERDDPYYVTNGLLVREMVSGKYVIGDTDSATFEPAIEAVAGDPYSVNEDAPTYESFKDVAALEASHKESRGATSRINLKVDETIDRKGQVRTLADADRRLADLVKIVNFDTNLNHNIPDVFWKFMNQTGMIYEPGQSGQNGRYIQDGTVFQPWVFTMGVPITEPYWIKTKVRGTERDVLVQLYERRVLTYTPVNPEAFRVEMGNVGQHYYRWRYNVPDEPDDANVDPRISDLDRTDLTSTTARIEWRTNKRTTTEVRYGLTKGNYPWSRRADEDTDGKVGYRTRHVVNIGGLQPETTYYYTVVSRDENGHYATEEGDPDHSFTTRATSADPPKVSNRVLAEYRSDYARVTWTTDKPATSRIEYGKTTSYGTVAGSTELKTSHTVELFNLSPDTVYYWHVISEDSNGHRAVVDGNSFKTRPS
jgi:hypothetical protein